MALAPKFGGHRDSEIIRQARQNLEATRDPEDNSIDNAALIAEVERLMSFYPVVERHKKAVGMVKAEWATDQAMTGRPRNEITMGNFVREKGFWRPNPIDPDDADDDD